MIRDEEINSEGMACPKTSWLLIWKEIPREDPQGGQRQAVSPWCPSPKECVLGLLCHQGIASSSLLRKEKGGKRKMI